MHLWRAGGWQTRDVAGSCPPSRWQNSFRSPRRLAPTRTSRSIWVGKGRNDTSVTRPRKPSARISSMVSLIVPLTDPMATTSTLHRRLDRCEAARRTSRPKRLNSAANQEAGAAQGSFVMLEKTPVKARRPTIRSIDRIFGSSTSPDHRRRMHPRRPDRECRCADFRRGRMIRRRTPSPASIVLQPAGRPDAVDGSGWFREQLHPSGIAHGHRVRNDRSVG